jgi:hypothetical protein
MDLGVNTCRKINKAARPQKRKRNHCNTYKYVVPKGPRGGLCSGRPDLFPRSCVPNPSKGGGASHEQVERRRGGAVLCSRARRASEPVTYWSRWSAFLLLPPRVAGRVVLGEECCSASSRPLGRPIFRPRFHRQPGEGAPPETKYFAETKFRRNEMAKRNGEIEIYFGEISPKFRRNEMTKCLFRRNFAKIARRNETK